MQDVKQLQAERNKLYNDFYNNIVPERMPVNLTLGYLIIADYFGANVINEQFDYSHFKEVADKAHDLIYSDCNPVQMFSRLPASYQMLRANTFKMADNGIMQHPEVEGMTEDEYPELIADAYACMIEKVVPRQYNALSLDNPAGRVNSILAMRSEDDRQRAEVRGVGNFMIEKYGYYVGAPGGSSGLTAAPYDFLSDQLRGFSGISSDIRRHRDEVKLACEKLLPLMFVQGNAPRPNSEGVIAMPLHMPPYMRMKDVEEIWLPTYLKLIQQLAARNIRTRPFLEQNWMRFMDMFQDFPANTLFMFEEGDPKLIKEKLGDKMLVTGLYPLMTVKTGTKDQVIDQAKELLDIMMPGCGYMFGFDKTPLGLNDVNMDNMKALTEYLRDNCKFDNPGTKFGTKLNAEQYEIDPHIGDIESKYFTNWEEYKKEYPLTPDSYRHVLHKYDTDILKYYIKILT